MAIAATFTLAFYVQVIVRSIYVAYHTVMDFITKKGNEEIDMASEIQHFMIMMQEHVMFLEGGPILVRMCALLAEVFLISEEDGE